MMARLRFNPNHEDSWVDLAGYAACGMQCAEKDNYPRELASVGAGGWVSHNRCGEWDTPNDQLKGIIGASPHPAHQYDRGAYWCDGYV